MEQISEYTQFVESLQKELAVPMFFRKQLYEKLGEKVTGLSYEEYEAGMKTMQEIRSQTYNFLTNSKIFILEDDIAQMLYLTDNEIFQRNIPFDNFFLETSFELEDRSIVKGIHIFREPKDKVVLGVYRIYPKDGIPFMVHFDLFCKKFSKESSFSENKLIKSMNEGDRRFVGCIRNKKIQTFICNFLDFLNDPEVELRVITRTEEQNQKRINRGKFPIPQINIIVIKGKLQIYQNNLPNGISFSYSHKFWVRGHFRTLRSKNRYKKLVGRRIWIKPYIKGKGILLSKIYDIKNPEVSA